MVYYIIYIYIILYIYINILRLFPSPLAPGPSVRRPCARPARPGSLAPLDLSVVNKKGLSEDPSDKHRKW